MQTSDFRRIATLVLAAFLTATSDLRGQELVGDLGRLAVDNAELYIEPLTRGLAFAIPSGLFDGAAPFRRFGFDIGIRVTGAFPPTSAEEFHPVLPTSIIWEGTTFSDAPPYRIRGGGSGATPTAAGRGPGVILEPNGDFEEALISDQRDPRDFEIQFPEGLDIPVVPFPLVQVAFGVGFGTDFSVRFVPEIQVDDNIGGVSARGFGIRHSITQWVPTRSPLDVSAIFGTQALRVGEYIDASSIQLGLLAGRDLGPLAVYASGILRSGSVDVTYTIENPDNNPGLPDDGAAIDFTTDIDQGVVFGLGARLSLLFMNLSGQYTFDDYSLVSLKIGFGRH